LRSASKPTPRSAQTHTGRPRSTQAEIVEQTHFHAETVNHHTTNKSTKERGELWRIEKVTRAMENREEKEKKWKRENEIG
jgi:hypothetical protein